MSLIFQKIISKTYRRYHACRRRRKQTQCGRNGSKEGPHRFRELVEWGTRFDKEKDGDFKLGREGGHTENRIVHHKDITGFEIERALLETVNKLPNIEVLDHHYVIDLLTQHHVPGKELNHDNIHCYGAYILDQKNKNKENYCQDHPCGNRRCRACL